LFETQSCDLLPSQLNNITEASGAGKKPAELGKANLLFWQRFKRDRVSTARKATVYFLMFVSNDAGPLVTVSRIRVKLKHGMFLTFSLSFPYKQLYFLPNKNSCLFFLAVLRKIVRDLRDLPEQSGTFLNI